MNTQPATFERDSATRAARPPPIESPTIATNSERLANSSNDSSADWDQSFQVVVIMSASVVPWPGSRGNSTP